MSITEAEIREEAIKVIGEAKGGFISTSDLIVALEERMEPTGRDAEIIAGRGDTYFSQKVRNLVSHRNSSSGLEARGLASYDAKREGWCAIR